MKETLNQAKRYAPAAQEAAHQIRYGLKGLMLYLLPAPTLIAALISLARGQITDTLITGGAFAAYMIAATIARHGFRLEGEYKRRKIARAPKTPYKTVAALLIGLTTGLLAWFGVGHSLFSSLLIGGGAVLGFALCYGLDPRKDKTSGLSLGVSVEEVLDALEAAEIRIGDIEKANRKINNINYNQKLERIAHKAREILGTIEDDPKRLSQARKFLKVYLDGTRKVTESYAKSANDPSGVTQALDTDFNNVLNSIEKTFDEQHERLLSNNNFNLDVQIEVLEHQLRREGTF